jgi:hypothetical protein
MWRYFLYAQYMQSCGPQVCRRTGQLIDFEWNMHCFSAVSSFATVLACCPLQVEGLMLSDSRDALAMGDVFQHPLVTDVVLRDRVLFTLEVGTHTACSN